MAAVWRLWCVSAGACRGGGTPRPEPVFGGVMVGTRRTLGGLGLAGCRECCPVRSVHNLMSYVLCTLGLSSRARTACALQLSNTASLEVLRLINASDHRGRPRTAARGSEGSQEKSRELHSPTSRCTARGCGCCSVQMGRRGALQARADGHPRRPAAGPGWAQRQCCRESRWGHRAGA